MRRNYKRLVRFDVVGGLGHQVGIEGVLDFFEPEMVVGGVGAEGIVGFAQAVAGHAEMAFDGCFIGKADNRPGGRACHGIIGIEAQEQLSVAAVAVLDELNEGTGAVIQEDAFIDVFLLEGAGGLYVLLHEGEDVGAADLSAEDAGGAVYLADRAGNTGEAPDEAAGFLGVFGVFEGQAVELLPDLLQHLFFIFEVIGGVAGDDNHEAGTLDLGGVLFEVFEVFVVIGGDIGGHHSGGEAHHDEADFTFSDFLGGAGQFGPGLEGEIANHEPGRCFGGGIMGRYPFEGEGGRTGPVIDLLGGTGKDAEAAEGHDVAADYAPEGRSGAVTAEPFTHGAQ